MQTVKILFIGVDVSKDELVIAIPCENKWQKHKVPNTLEAISKWLEDLGTLGMHFVLEATGPYSERLIFALNQRGCVFSVVNPAQSRAMSKALLKTNKNDDQDAQTLSLLGEKLGIKPYKMPNMQQKKRKEAFSALVSLQKQEQQLKNQLHAFEYRVQPNPVAVEALQNVLSTVQEAIVQLEKELNLESDEEENQQIIQRIASIKGVGLTTAQACVTLFGNFKHFEDTKAFVKFIGLSPTEFTSGATIRGKSHISKKGNGKIRSLLFNCARSAMKYNKNCKELYQRLIEKGRNGRIALTAVMHKLARLIFGVVRSGVDYNDDFAILKQKSVN